MSIYNIVMSFSVVVLAAMPLGLRADTDEIEKEEVANTQAAEKPGWSDAIKTKYNLTDEQMTQLNNSGISKSQMAVVADMSQQSGKSIDDILKMRTEQKMGWGKIAKELGLHPGTIGKSISSLRHEIRDERKADRHELRDKRKEARADRKEERAEKRAERKENKGKKP